MQKHLVALGAGGFAREMYWHILGTYPEARVVFVDDVSDVDEVPVGRQTVPVVRDWKFGEVRGARFEEFVLGIGNPATKKTLVERALESGLRPAPTVLHPRALVQGADLPDRRGRCYRAWLHPDHQRPLRGLCPPEPELHYWP